MRVSVSAVLFLLVFLGLATAISAQTTEFTYQGNLQNASQPATGNFDFEFLLFDAVSAGNQVGSAVAMDNVSVADGLFTVKLNFGAQFSGANRFLEIRVRPSGQPGYTILAPRQLINSVPYAVKSLNATTADTAANATNASQLSGLSADQYVLTNDTRMSDAPSS